MTGSANTQPEVLITSLEKGTNINELTKKSNDAIKKLAQDLKKKIIDLKTDRPNISDELYTKQMDALVDAANQL